MANCNRDPGYPGSWAAGIDRGELTERWTRERPELEVPQVMFSDVSGKYELTEYNLPKKV